MSKNFSLQVDYRPSGDQFSAIEKLLQGIGEKKYHQTLLGVTGSGKTFTMANIIDKLHRPAIIMAPNKTLAAQLYGEMKSYFPHNAIEYFVSYYDYYQPEAYVPASDTYIEKDAAINEHIEQMRLSATKALLERRDVIIVATVSAIYGLGDPALYSDMLLHLSCGMEIDQRKILRSLTQLQYLRNDIELRRGTYRVRGDVIDVFPADSHSEAIRISLFGDEIETLAYFDPLTGEMLQNMPRLSIYPKSHYVTPRGKLLEAVDKIKSELKVRLKSLRVDHQSVEAQRLEQRTQFDIEMMLELGYCSGIENYSRYLSGRASGEPPPTLLEYAPQDTILFLDESHVMLPQLRAMYLGDRSRKETLVTYGFRLPSALDNRPLTFEEFAKLNLQTIYVSATPGNYEFDNSEQIVEQIVRPTGLVDPKVEVRPAITQVEDVLSEINKTLVANERVLITTLTKRMAEDLTEFLNDQGIKVRYLHSDIATVERVEIIRDLRLGMFDVLVGINLLREGLDIPEVSLVAIFDADKEGFLRSERSLIQTMGRASRNVHGQVILYADKKTDSMKRAMAETSRRRKIQIEFNKAHGITAKTIIKSVPDIMGGVIVAGRYKKKGKERKLSPIMEEIVACKQNIHTMSEKVLAKKIMRWETQMYVYARNLEFEVAAQIRDELQALEVLAFQAGRMLS